MSKTESGLLVLPNGIKVSWLALPHTRLAHCAFVFDTGSRDEGPGQIGMAHFMEHMLFKGTRRRKAHHILNRIDSVGGEIDAYTTKEKTYYYTAAAAEYLERSFELLADVTLAPSFPPKEIEKEKIVVADEIDMYLDNPEESVQEEFDAMVFAGHSLGNRILGDKASVAAFDQAGLQAFHAAQYGGDGLTVALAGAVDERKATRLAEKYLANLSFPARKPLPRAAPRPAEPCEAVLEAGSQQTSLALGGPAFSRDHALRPALQLLTYYLGGPAMNNRLNMEVREKHGLTYNIYAYYYPFSDAGLWGAYAGCDPRNARKVERLVRKELVRQCDKTLSPAKLKQLKRQFLGHLMLSHENAQNRLLHLARDVQDYGAEQSIDRITDMFEAVSAAQMQEAAQSVLAPGNLSLAIYEGQFGE